MSRQHSTAPITIHAAQETVDGIDALAAATDRSRDDIVNQALQHYLEVNTWQVERIVEGLDAAREGRLQPAEDVFANIGRKHGWSR
jgi:predicted transcriptional regulator